VAVACVAAVALVTSNDHPTRVGEGSTPVKPDAPATNYEHPCGTRSTHPSTYTHVIWIMFGERGYNQVFSDHAKAAYLHTLAKQCGLATNYTSVTHPGLPNLIASVAGTPAGFTRNHDTGQTSARSLFKQVPSWGVYMESMPTPCHTTDAPNVRYVARMNPGIFFSGLRCRARDVPLGTPASGALATALDKGTLPQFTVMVPNECDSMSFSHGCAAHKRNAFVSLGDYWLDGWMKRLLGSPLYQSGSTAIFITWVDGTPSAPVDHDCFTDPIKSCHVGALVVAPSVTPGVQLPTPFSHYSLLRTTEELLGVKRNLGSAQIAPSMRAAFGL
jgi:hypothetical protein